MGKLKPNSRLVIFGDCLIPNFAALKKKKKKKKKNENFNVNEGSRLKKENTNLFYTQNQ